MNANFRVRAVHGFLGRRTRAGLRAVLASTKVASAVRPLGAAGLQRSLEMWRLWMVPLLPLVSGVAAAHANSPVALLRRDHPPHRRAQRRDDERKASHAMIANPRDRDLHHTGEIARQPPRLRPRRRPQGPPAKYLLTDSAHCPVERSPSGRYRSPFSRG